MRCVWDEVGVEEKVSHLEIPILMIPMCLRGWSPRCVSLRFVVLVVKVVQEYQDDRRGLT